MKFKSGLNFVKKYQNVITFYACSLIVLSVPKVIPTVTVEWMSKVHWGMILAGKIKVFRQNPVHVTLCPLQLPHGLFWVEHGPPR